MIKPTAFNRDKIKTFLATLSEDALIEKVIIPLFSLSGYILYRINMHGPGEHGKDIIFYRHVPLFYDQEYIAVQAKAEKATTSNVSHFAQQLNRAIQVPFSAVSGGPKKANYAIFINSKEHTNDAHQEFNSLVNNNANIKILSQQTLVELFIYASFVPAELKGQLEELEFKDGTIEEEYRRIIAGGSEKEINDLFENMLLIETMTLSKEFKGLAINYIFLIWSRDKSWAGTVKPMKWLNTYFDFIQPDQYPKLLDVFREYASDYPSREANSFTIDIIRKIKSRYIKAFEKEFILFALYRFINSSFNKAPLLEKKILQYADSEEAGKKYHSILKLLKEQIALYDQIANAKSESEKDALRPTFKQNSIEITEFIENAEDIND